MVLPSGLTTTVAGIDTFDGPLDEAYPPMSVTMRLADDIDVSRGDMICRPHNQPDRRPGPRRHGLLDDRSPGRSPATSSRSSTPPGGCGRWCETSTTGSTSTRSTATNRRRRSTLNEVGRVSLRVTQPLFYDSYRRNRQTGSFILAAEDTNVTVGAGMLLGPD